MIPEKSSHVLNWILIALLLMVIRVGYLSIIEHDHLLSLARKPQRKVITEPPKRGTIRDRFNEPIAINKVHFAAAIRYDELRSIPGVRIKRGEKGKKEKVYVRKAYIEKLSSFLGKKLDLDSTYIEDIIQSKASIFPNTPFVLKEGLTEKEYYSLLFLEKDWPGLEMQISSKRFYPQGKLASHVVGYLGSINERHYLQIAEERDLLQKQLKEREEGLPAVLPKGYESFDEVKKRLKFLQEKSYRFNDVVGRAGIEKKFDEQLRGDIGTKQVEVDIKGRFKRELPGASEPTPGKRALLSISSEMQKLAEELLIENETLRDENFSRAGKDHNTVPSPWIKGGSIVAMVPKTGEIVAMASYPRFDPNDFILFSSPDEISKKQQEIHRWLESDTYIAGVWDGKRPLEKEVIDKKKGIITEKRFLHWDRYLEMVLSLKGSVKGAFDKKPTIENTLYLVNAMQQLLSLTKQTKMAYLIDAMFPKAIPTHLKPDDETLSQIRESIPEDIAQEITTSLSFIPNNDDKLLYLDLCRLCLDNARIPEDLLDVIGTETLSLYRKENQAFSLIESQVKTLAEPLFLKLELSKWREKHFKEYLKAKREEEKKKNSYQKPYLDYLQEKQRELFHAFWAEHRISLILNYLLGARDDTQLTSYFDAFESQQQEEEKSSAFFLLKGRLERLPAHLIKKYLLSMRNFADLRKPLWGHYRFFKSTGPIQLEKHLASAFYPPSGYGHCKSHAFEQAAPMGSIFKIITAYEALRQHYLKASTSLSSVGTLNPLTIIDETHPSSTAMQLGSFLNGKPIPRIYNGGRIPKSHRSIGRVDLLDAMEQSSNVYFSLLASDVLDHPTDLIDAAKIFGLGQKTGLDIFGEISGNLPSDIQENRTGLYALAIGQHSLTVTPLQTAQMLGALANGGYVLKPQIIHTIAGLERNYGNDPEKMHFAYKESLANVGIYFPFFRRLQPSFSSPSIAHTNTEIIHEFFMPPSIKDYLLESLYRVTTGPRGAAHGNRIRYLYGKPKQMREYIAIQKQMVGKTSTAEILYRPTLDREASPIICKHIWFGGISFTSAEQNWDEPELVVVVYLRYGDYGKEAAPLAAKLIAKWREINSE